MKNALCTDGDESPDILDTWSTAKARAQAETDTLRNDYPVDVVQRIFEALTCQYFWEMWRK